MGTVSNLYSSGSSLQRVGAALQRLPFVVGKLRFKHLDHTFPADNARQRERDVIARVIGANRDRRPFIAQHDLRDARGNHADSVLTGANPLDNGDIRVTDLVLDIAAEFLAIVGLLLKQREYWRSGDTRRRPNEHLGRAMLSQNMRVDRGRGDA